MMNVLTLVVRSTMTEHFLNSLLFTRLPVAAHATGLRLRRQPRFENTNIKSQRVLEAGQRLRAAIAKRTSTKSIRLTSTQLDARPLYSRTPSEQLGSARFRVPAFRATRFCHLGSPTRLSQVRAATGKRLPQMAGIR